MTPWNKDTVITHREQLESLLQHAEFNTWLHRLDHADAALLPQAADGAAKHVHHLIAARYGIERGDGVGAVGAHNRQPPQAEKPQRQGLVHG